MNTPQKWVNAGPDEGAMHALLARVTEQIPVERMDELWIFPTRIGKALESTVIAVAAFDDDPERRAVATAHFTVTRNKRGRAQVNQRMLEHGLAPSVAIARVVEGVLRRLGDEVGQETPQHVELRGDADAYADLVEALGGERPVAHDEPAQVDESTAPEESAQVDDGDSTPPHGDPLHHGGMDTVPASPSTSDVPAPDPDDPVA